MRTEAVPWAETSLSRFAAAFEQQVAWLCVHCNTRTVSQLMRVGRHTVGGICARVEATNNKIKVTQRMAYGFRNVDDPVALVMLRRSDLAVTLPGRAA